MSKSKMFLSFLSILVISSLLFITNCSENPLEYEEKDLNSGSVADAVERGWIGPMDEVPYISQLLIGDPEGGHFYRCAAATHAMAYGWLEEKGKVDNAPSNQNYKDATIKWKGGTWNQVNNGRNGSNDPKGIGEVFGRQLAFDTERYQDREDAFCIMINNLKGGYPVKTAILTGSGNGHSILIVGYNKDDVEIKVYDPLYGKYKKSKSWLKEKWDDYYKKGKVVLATPEGDRKD